MLELPNQPENALAKQGPCMQATAVILAAGLGTRMKSSLPKTLHRLAGRTMLRHLLASCEPVFDRIVVVLGPDMDAVRKEAEPHICVVQEQRLGTAHAALQAIEHFGDGHVAVLYADNPLIRTPTLRRLLDSHTPRGLSLLAFRTPDPGRYGRVITGTDALVERIVEYADASSAERAVNLCNAGVLCGAAADMRRWLQAVRNDNAKAEYYLTDVVALARADGRPVSAVEAPEDELAGVNARGELARAEAVLQGWLREAAMEAGVTMIDPSSVFLSADTRLSPDVTIEPNVFFGPGRDRRQQRHDPRVQPHRGRRHRCRQHHRPVRPPPPRRQTRQTTFMSATSSKSRPPTCAPG